MSPIVLFEIKKFFRRKKNLISLLMLCGFIIFIIIIGIELDKTKIKGEIRCLQDNIKSSQDFIKNLNSEFINEDMPENLKRDIKRNQYFIDLYKSKIKALKINNFQEALKMEIELQKNELGLSSGDEFKKKASEEDKVKYMRNEFLLDKKIKPIYIESSVQGYNFLRSASEDLFPIIIPILILVISADIVSLENEQGTFKFLLMQPISRIKVMIGKIIGICLCCVMSILFIFFMSFIILGIVEGFGASNYPIIMEGELIGIRTIIIKLLPLEILYMIFIASVGILISTIIGYGMSSIGISIILNISLYFLSSNILIKSLNKIIHFNPFIYSQFYKVLDGNIAKTFQNPSINLNNGILVLAVSILMLNSISIFLFSRKDITC